MKLTLEEFNNLIDKYKDNESTITSVILVGNTPLLKFCGVYNNFKPKFIPHEYEELPTDFSDLWCWLWLNVEIDFSMLSVSLGYSINKLELLYAQLIASRLIYPDGSITNLAKLMVQAEIKSMFKNIQTN